jgi:hypothetical protein
VEFNLEWKKGYPIGDPVFIYMISVSCFFDKRLNLAWEIINYGGQGMKVTIVEGRKDAQQKLTVF